MNYRNRICSIVACLILLCMFSSQSWSQQDRWGLGITPQYDIPLFNFNNRFAGGPNIGLKFSYEKTNTSYEIIYFNSKFSQGKIEDLTFQWVLDGENYTSPQASSEFSSKGILAVLKKPFRLSIGPLVSYWSIGSGFVTYQHQIKDLIFPGQTILHLDPTFTYSPEVENQTAFSLNFGGGLRYRIGSQLDVDLNVRYNIVFGYLRPMEAWFLEKVSPMQSLSIGIDLSYYFTK